MELIKPGAFPPLLKNGRTGVLSAVHPQTKRWMKYIAKYQLWRD
jgi:hypothetical protein